ncbi:hypothetical protein, partial [Pseudoalteromonas phenolica]|uniref:hypothetical protein n=1 Tax=Pseudoalteromonas phenolica TaxID=161398 RepID=UPI0019D437EF
AYSLRSLSLTLCTTFIPEAGSHRAFMHSLPHAAKLRLCDSSPLREKNVSASRCVINLSHDIHLAQSKCTRLALNAKLARCH